MQLAIAAQTPLKAQYHALGTVSPTLASDLSAANQDVDRLTPLTKQADIEAKGLETNLGKIDFEALKQSAADAQSFANKIDSELKAQLQTAIKKAEKLEKQVTDYETLKQNAEEARSKATGLSEELETAESLAKRLQETSTLVSELNTATAEVDRLTSLSLGANATLASFGDGIDKSGVENATIAFDEAVRTQARLTLQKQEVLGLLEDLLTV